MLKVVNALVATTSGSASFCMWTGRAQFPSRCGGLRRGPVGFAHRVRSPGGPKYLGSNGEWRPFTCVSFDRVLYILRELPTNNALRAAIELSRDLMPSGMQSGSEVLYFTLGATWDFLVIF